jgi:hypothetical protein
LPRGGNFGGKTVPVPIVRLELRDSSAKLRAGWEIKADHFHVQRKFGTGTDIYLHVPAKIRHFLSDPDMDPELEVLNFDPDPELDIKKSPIQLAI